MERGQEGRDGLQEEGLGVIMGATVAVVGALVVVVGVLDDLAGVRVVPLVVEVVPLGVVIVLVGVLLGERGRRPLHHFPPDSFGNCDYLSGRRWDGRAGTVVGGKAWQEVEMPLDAKFERRRRGTGMLVVWWCVGVRTEVQQERKWTSEKEGCRGKQKGFLKVTQKENW